METEQRFIKADVIKQQSIKGADILYISAPGSQDVDLTNCNEFDRLLTEEGREYVVYIRLPYQSAQLTYTYEDDAENPWLRRAEEIWADEKQSLDRGHPTAAVVVDGDKEVSYAGNGKRLEYPADCERKKLQVATGTRYDLCDGNHASDQHAEYKANGIVNEQKLNPDNHALMTILYGHWWACESCCGSMESANTTQLIMSKDWTKQFLEIEDIKP